MQKKYFIWIVGKKTDYIEKRIKCRQLSSNTEIMVCRNMEDAQTFILDDAIPALMLTEPEYAIPPNSGTYIPVIGIVDFPREKWRKEYTGRCIPASMLSAHVLNDLISSGLH